MVRYQSPQVTPIAATRATERIVMRNARHMLATAQAYSPRISDASVTRWIATMKAATRIDTLRFFIVS